MTANNQTAPIDILVIEREARALRARAVASMAATFRAWIRARLTGRPAMPAAAR